MVTHVLAHTATVDAVTGTCTAGLGALTARQSSGASARACGGDSTNAALPRSAAARPCGGPELAPFPTGFVGDLVGERRRPTRLNQGRAGWRCNVSARQSHFPGPIPTAADDPADFSKLTVRVRFPSPAPPQRPWSGRMSGP
jgi:hypothetical protein